MSTWAERAERREEFEREHTISSRSDYTTSQAAQYCGLTLRGFIYHIRQGHIAAAYRIGRNAMYTRKTLDTFNASRRKAGRPRKTKTHDAQGDRT